MLYVIFVLIKKNINHISCNKFLTNIHMPGIVNDKKHFIQIERKMFTQHSHIQNYIYIKYNNFFFFTNKIEMLIIHHLTFNTNTV